MPHEGRDELSHSADYVAHDRDGIVFDLGSVYERLSALMDPRHRRGIRYELAVILVAALIAEWAREDCGGRGRLRLDGQRQSAPPAAGH